ncbi:hypothetical protein EFW57_03437 [Bacillus velezensis]|nr:hypothetical protein EFW57_03437 [Bacillus velezensis]
MNSFLSGFYDALINDLLIHLLTQRLWESVFHQDFPQFIL